MKKILSFLLYHGITLCWMGIIFYFSSRQRISMADDLTVNFMIFKFFHLSEYVILYLLVRRSLIYGSTLFRVYGNAYAILFGGLYAIFDEFHQTFVPTRQGSLRDIGIDVIGLLLGVIIIRFIIPKWRRVSKYLSKIKVI